MKYEYETVAYVEEDIAKRLVQLLRFSEIPEATIVHDPLNNSCEVQVYRYNYRKANDLVRVFKENEFNENYNEDLNFGNDEAYEEITVPTTGIYVKTEDKYKDNISSAYTFLICGVLGLIVLLLDNLNLINIIGATGSSKILFNVTIGCFFIAFIVIGIRALIYSQKLKKQAIEENAFMKTIFQQLENNLTKSDIDKACDLDTPEEMKYFQRIEIIKAHIIEAFGEMNDDFLAKICDDYYYHLWE